MFGIVITEIMNQQEPHLEQDPLEIAKQIRDHGITPSLSHDCPEFLKELCARCCSVEPNDRPDFEWLCEQLNQYCQQHGIKV